MQKKIYIKDLEDSEILDRLLNGQKAYDSFSQSEEYIVYQKGFLISYNNENRIIAIGREFHPHSGDYFFIDNVKESEADKSCIGKLCWFWDSESRKIISVLKSYNTGSGFPYEALSGGRYEHCRPLTKKEALEFIKE